MGRFRFALSQFETRFETKIVMLDVGRGVGVILEGLSAERSQKRVFATKLRNYLINNIL